MREHKLHRDINSEKLVCSVCLWTWKTAPVMECPGVVRYDRWGDPSVPEGLLTKTELKEMKLKPGAPRAPSSSVRAKGPKLRAGAGSTQRRKP